jgi:selenocysteine lyase/cysteine desulfurase
LTIYLDNAATSWPKPEAVCRAVDDFMREVGATPGRGGHRREEEAMRIAGDTREAGTRNAAGIARLLAGVRFVLEESAEHICAHEMEMTGLLMEELRVIPNVTILGPDDLARRDDAQEIY